MSNGNTPSLNENELAVVAQQFLSRVDLKGHEVPMFSRVINWLVYTADKDLKAEPSANQRPTEPELNN